MSRKAKKKRPPRPKPAPEPAVPREEVPYAPPDAGEPLEDAPPPYEPPPTLTEDEVAAAYKRLPADARRRVAEGLVRAEREGWRDEIRVVQDVFALAEGAYFDRRFADDVCGFIEGVLVHQTGEHAGKPFLLLPWQRDLLRPGFGWRNARGRRLCRSIFLYVAKKNGKSTLAAAVGIYVQVAEPDPDRPARGPEQGQEIYLASTTRANGEIIYREACKLAAGSPKLAEHMHAVKSTGYLACAANSSFMRVLSHKADSAEGFIAGCVILDEVHAMKSADLANALRYAGRSRRQPLEIMTTTAGIDNPLALWRVRYRYAQKVLAGDVIDPSLRAALYEADSDVEDLADPVQLRKANPSVGHTISMSELQSDGRTAMAEGPTSVSAFKRYRMNVAAGQEQGWLDPEAWRRCQEPFDLAEMAGRRCLMGLDLAKVSDFTALVALWPPLPGEEDGTWHAKAWFMLPRSAITARSRAGDESWARWAEEGRIDVTEGSTTDFKRVQALCAEHGHALKAEHFGIDRGFDGWQFAEDLYHIEDLPATNIGQGWRSQDVPMQRIETLVTQGRLNFGGCPVMQWMAGNALAARVGPNENLHLDKRRAPDKVDGLAALINAMYLAEALAEEDPTKGHGTLPFNPLADDDEEEGQTAAAA